MKIIIRLRSYNNHYTISDDRLVEDATKNFALDDGRFLIPQNVIKYVLA